MLNSFRTMDNGNLNNLYQVAYDDGNWATKVITNDAEVMYTSGVTPVMNSMDANEDGKDIITIEGEKFIVGESRDAMQYNKSNDKYALIRMLPAIAYSITKSNLSHVQDIALAIGTPLTQAALLKDQYIEYFKGKEVNFVYKNESFHLTFPYVQCYPQDYAVMLRNYDKHFKCQTVSILADIGGGTTDVLILEHIANKLSGGKTPVVKNKKTFNIGIIHLVNQIKSELSVMGIDARDEIILNAIQGETVCHKYADYIGKTCVAFAEKFVRDLVSMLKENGYDLSYPVFFIGGGYKLLQVYFNKYDDEIFKIADFDALENARSFLWLLKEQMKKEAKGMMLCG